MFQPASAFQLLVASLAFFAVTPDARADALPASELTRRIDRAIQATLDAEKTPTSPISDDAEFVRRIYLDLHGVVPPPERVVAFLNNKDAVKRSKLIDELLASSDYGRHFSLMWYNRMIPQTALARRIVSPALRDWLAEGFNKNRGWNQIVSDILLAQGEREQNPATSFYLVYLGDGENPRPEPEKVTAAVTRLFLGVRLECCQCHNHPFTTLKQTEFWGMAAFFMNIRAENVGRGASPKGPGPDLKEGVTVGISKPNRPLAPISLTGAIDIPESQGKTAQAKFLGGELFDPQGKPIFRPAFAAWAVAPENPYFARAAVNRMWANFFGRGLIEPVDDMRPEFEPSHPELFDLLTKEFVASGFDQTHLIRCIANSQAYQRTSTPPKDSEYKPERYGHMAARVMTADQLYDSLTQILKHPVGEVIRGGQSFKYGDGRERFRLYFHGGGADDNTPVPEYGHGIPQVLRIMNSANMTDASRVMPKLAPANASREKVIENLYLATHSRRPTSSETQRAVEFLASEADRTKGYSDILWALLNSGEFLHNH